MFKLTLLAILFVAVSVQAGMVQEAIETAVYKAYEAIQEAQGKTRAEASCMSWVMKRMGATSDVTNILNIINPEELAKKLSEKSDFATVVCYNFPFGMLVIIVFMIFILCCCCACCCHSEKPPAIINFTMPSTTQNRVQYPHLLNEEV